MKTLRGYATPQFSVLKELQNWSWRLKGTPPPQPFTPWLHLWCTSPKIFSTSPSNSTKIQPCPRGPVRSPISRVLDATVPTFYTTQQHFMSTFCSGVHRFVQHVCHLPYTLLRLECLCQYQTDLKPSPQSSHRTARPLNLALHVVVVRKVERRLGRTRPEDFCDLQYQFSSALQGGVCLAEPWKNITVIEFVCM